MGPRVMVLNKLNTSQCTPAATKANQILDDKNRGIISRDTDTIISLHSVFVRPPLDYCVQFSSREMQRLEKIQRMAKKIIKKLGHWSCEERQKELGLFSLEKRQLEREIITIFQYNIPVQSSRWRISLHEEAHGEDKE